MTRLRWPPSRTSPRNSGPTSSEALGLVVVIDVSQRLAGQEFAVVTQRRLGDDRGEQQLPHLRQALDQVAAVTGPLAHHPCAEGSADDRLAHHPRVEVF